MLYDIFISYSHKDNIAKEELKGWVDEFHFELNRCLTEFLGRFPKIWRDTTKMRGNQRLAEAVFDGLDDCRIFLPIMSPSYLASEWCPKELNQFHLRSNNPQSIETLIFPVVKVPIRTTPPEVKGNFFKYQFFETNKLSGNLQLLTPWSQTHDKFSDLIAKLANEIADYILQFEESPPPNEPSPPPIEIQSATDCPIIYLAEPSGDLIKDYEQIKEDLKRRKELGQVSFDIFDYNHSHKNTDVALYQKDIEKQIQNCHVAIQFIGKDNLGYPRLSEKSYLELQFETLTAHGKDLDFKNLIWLKDADNGDPEHRIFIENIHKLASKKNLVLENPLEEFKNIIQDAIKPKEQVEKLEGETELPELDKPRWVYVLSDDYFEDDIKTVRTLEKQLTKIGCSVWSSRDVIQNPKRTEVHQDILNKCDAVLIYFYRTPTVWVKDRLYELDKTLGYERKTPFRAKGVFCYGDLPHQKEADFPRDVLKLEGFQELSQFITELSSDAEVKAI